MELKNIVIDPNELMQIKKEMDSNSGANPACCSTEYWEKRINITIEDHVKGQKGLSYGFVGDGWPYTCDQSFAVENDTKNLREAYSGDDLNCRDVGDAIYQCNVLLEHMVVFPEKPHIFILDFGGGYGRLAIPFLHHLKNVTYISIDYPPVSLLIAPQVIKQFFPDKKVRKWDGNGNIQDYDFVSLPAWRIEDIDNILFNLFITVHSFQEMTIEAISFYTKFIDSHASFGRSAFYSVNLWPDNYWKANWTPIFDRAYPINRDGSFNEKFWRID